MCGTEKMGGLGMEVQLNDMAEWGSEHRCLEVLGVGSGRGELTPCPRLCCAQLGDAYLDEYTQPRRGDRWLSGVAL